jgi:hypothetical protein
MSDDLVKRLRAPAKWARHDIDQHHPDRYGVIHYDRAPYEAADRIEALERERDAAIRELGEWARKAGTAEQGRDEVQTALNAALYAVNSALREALEEAERVARGYSASDVPAPMDEVSYGWGRAHAAAAIRALKEGK